MGNEDPDHCSSSTVYMRPHDSMNIVANFGCTYMRKRGKFRNGIRHWIELQSMWITLIRQHGVYEVVKGTKTLCPCLLLISSNT